MPRQRKGKSLAPSPEQVQFEVFQIADSPPLGGGHYWHLAERQLLRGPFATAEQADADAKQLGLKLLSAIDGIKYVDTASADLNKQAATALIKEFGERKP